MSTYLIKRAGHYHYRRAVPAAWRHLLGQREWKQSLKTSSRTEAEIKARALAVQHDELLAELEIKGPDEIAKQRYQEVQQTFDHQEKSIYRWFQSTELTDEDELELYRQLHLLKLNRRAKVKALGVKPDPRVVQKAFLEYGYEGEFGAGVAPPRDRQEYYEWLGEKHKTEAMIADLAPEENKLLAVADDWHRHVGHRRQTWRKHLDKLNRFVSAVGDLPIDQITREQVEMFRDGLIKSGISATTVQKYLDVLKALFRWAKRERRLIKINPAEDVTAPRDTRSSDKKGRRPFSPQELQTILKAAQAAWSKRGRDRDLLMMLRVLMYTGARPMEIAQLRPCDVQDGVISINDHDGKQIKNEASIRDIPIHPEIADFEKFAKSGGKLVFKSFDTIQDRKAEALSTRFTRLIRRQMNIIDQRKTLYSLRHNFADACRNARLTSSIQYQLMGHVEGNRNAAGYGTGASIETLRSELAKVDPLR